MTPSTQFAPYRWFSRLSYPQKFLVISLLFILPLFAFGPLVYQQIVRINQYGTREYQGVLYLRPLQELMQDVQRHEQKIAHALSINATPDLSTEQARIASDIVNLEAIDQTYGRAFNTGNGVADIREAWQSLQQNVDAFDVISNIERHNRLIEMIRGMISLIGDESFLILDPDLDTYYVMDSVLLKLPEVQTYLSDITVLSTQVIADGDLADVDQREQIVRSTSLLEDRFSAMDNGLRYAMQQNETGQVTPRNASGQMRGIIEEDLNTAAQAYRALQEVLDAKLIGGQGAPTAQELSNLSQASFDANARLYESASEALELGTLARQQRYTTLLTVSLIIAIAGAIVGIISGLAVMQSISRPLSQLIQTAKRLSTGDLTARVPVTSDDEVGQVAIAFNASIENLSDLVSKVVDSSAKLSSGTTEISAASNEMSAGAESQTQQAIRTSSAMEEIAATIKEVANNADLTSRATMAAATRAKEGSARVQIVLKQLAETNTSLQQLRVRSSEIDQLVKLIADIAAQTNILSLNAAIEAAGAGAAGARFDVVAEEIRKLAQRTAESTARISGSVNQIQVDMQSVAQRTDDLASQAVDVGQTLGDIVEGVTSVNDMIANISASTSQQSRAVEQVAMSLQVITQVSQQTAQAAQETASTIDDLSGLAHTLNVTANRFKV